MNDTKDTNLKIKYIKDISPKYKNNIIYKNKNESIKNINKENEKIDYFIDKIFRLNKNLDSKSLISITRQILDRFHLGKTIINEDKVSYIFLLIKRAIRKYDKSLIKDTSAMVTLEVLRKNSIRASRLYLEIMKYLYYKNSKTVDIDRYKKIKYGLMLDKGIIALTAYFRVVDVSQYLIECIIVDICDIMLEKKNVNIKEKDKERYLVLTGSNVTDVIKVGDVVEMVIIKRLFMSFWNMARVDKCIY